MRLKPPRHPSFQRQLHTSLHTLCCLNTHTHTHPCSQCVCPSDNKNLEQTSAASARFVWPQRLKSINLIRAAFTYWTSASSSLMNPLLGSLNHLERDERTWNRFTLYWTQDTHTHSAQRQVWVFNSTTIEPPTSCWVHVMTHGHPTVTRTHTHTHTQWFLTGFELREPRTAARGD